LGFQSKILQTHLVILCAHNSVIIIQLVYRIIYRPIYQSYSDAAYSDYSMLKNFQVKTDAWKSRTELISKQLSGFHCERMSSLYSPEMNSLNTMSAVMLEVYHRHRPKPKMHANLKETL